MTQAQGTAQGGSEAIRPFHVHFPDDDLADLKRRMVDHDARSLAP